MRRPKATASGLHQPWLPSCMTRRKSWTLAAAIHDRDAENAVLALTRAHNTHRLIVELKGALQAGQEIVMIAPVRGGDSRHLDRYRMLVTPIDCALRNATVLMRRAVVALQGGETF